MKTVCNWYHAETLLKDDGNPDGKVSHGLCRECLERFRTESGLPPVETPRFTHQIRIPYAALRVN